MVNEGLGETDPLQSTDFKVSIKGVLPMTPDPGNVSR
jgi:hypothetical protein